MPGSSASPRPVSWERNKGRMLLPSIRPRTKSPAGDELIIARLPPP